MGILVLDGPMGTELHERGVATPLPRWSASALHEAPATVEAVHRDYALAGATVHTANTFRTGRRVLGDGWEEVTRRAVSLARRSVFPEHRVAGSMAPLEDCYRPDLSPPEPRAEHREMAAVLRDAGCDLLLCETFPHAGEALTAVEEAASTGLPVWLSLTAGPDADLMTPEEMASAAGKAVRRGASAVLVNCVPASRTLEYVRSLSRVGVPFGAYANAGRPDERFGWRAENLPAAARAYGALAQQWVSAGATIVGSCCGTGPAHIAELARRFGK